MTKNPIVNALAAAVYIAIVASIMFYGQSLVGPAEDNVLAPLTIISLFTLSAAMMGYIFLYQPLQMYLDGSKKEAANLFVRTVGSFAVITVLLFLSMLYSSR